jgi:hypothetical protein
LLFRCSHCGGRGEYTGLITVEHCRACNGRGLIPG